MAKAAYEREPLIGGMLAVSEDESVAMTVKSVAAAGRLSAMVPGAPLRLNLQGGGRKNQRLSLGWVFETSKF